MSASVPDLYAARRRAVAVKQAAQARKRRTQAALAAGEAYHADDVKAVLLDASVSFRQHLWASAPGYIPNPTGISPHAVKAISREVLGLATGILRDCDEALESRLKAAEVEHADALARLAAILQPIDKAA